MTGRRKRGKAVAAAVSPEGLLCALALDPCSVPRNRHFLLYTATPARDAHRRAATLRRLRRELAAILERGTPALQVHETDDVMWIRYEDETLALRRAIALTPLEASLLRCMLAAAEPAGQLSERGGDRDRVKAALARVDAKFGIDPQRLVA